jgi:hypothetical protein
VPKELSCILVEQFDIATHLQTAPELVDRVFNRPRIETLQKEKVKGVTHQTRLKVIFSIVTRMGVWQNLGSFFFTAAFNIIICRKLEFL